MSISISPTNPAVLAWVTTTPVSRLKLSGTMATSIFSVSGIAGRRLCKKEDTTMDVSALATMIRARRVALAGIVSGPPLKIQIRQKTETIAVMPNSKLYDRIVSQSRLKWPGEKDF
ncbi:uncharacterized protein METZ01_LOCUS432854, partial [marine metagenome]